MWLLSALKWTPSQLPPVRREEAYKGILEMGGKAEVQLHRIEEKMGMRSHRIVESPSQDDLGLLSPAPNPLPSF